MNIIFPEFAQEYAKWLNTKETVDIMEELQANKTHQFSDRQSIRVIDAAFLQNLSHFPLGEPTVFLRRKKILEAVLDGFKSGAIVAQEHDLKGHVTRRLGTKSARMKMKEEHSRKDAALELGKGRKDGQEALAEKTNSLLSPKDDDADFEELTEESIENAKSSAFKHLVEEKTLPMNETNLQLLVANIGRLEIFEDTRRAKTALVRPEDTLANSTWKQLSDLLTNILKGFEKAREEEKEKWAELQKIKKEKEEIAHREIEKQELRLETGKAEAFKAEERATQQKK
jgi:hypothetical protein